MPPADPNVVQHIYGFAEVTLDKSSRFLIQAEFFERLKARTPMRMTVDPQGRCLEVRTEEMFMALATRIRAAARGLSADAVQALMIEYLGYSVEVQADNAYRLTIPKKMRDAIGEETELVLVGVGDAVQIWTRSAFRASQHERRIAILRELPRVVNAVYGIDPIPAPAPAPKEADA